MNYPEYSLPFRLIPGLIASLLLGHPRSFQADARLCTGRLCPPLSIQGEENIPGSGPCVLTVNHYHRPGFGAWWISLAVSAVVPRELHWVMTAEWTFPGRWYGFLGKLCHAPGIKTGSEDVQLYHNAAHAAAPRGCCRPQPLGAQGSQAYPPGSTNHAGNLTGRSRCTRRSPGLAACGGGAFPAAPGKGRLSRLSRLDAGKSRAACACALGRHTGWLIPGERQGQGTAQLPVRSCGR